MKISLKILEFYGAKYLLKSFLSMMIFSKYIFLWILALSEVFRATKLGTKRHALVKIKILMLKVDGAVVTRKFVS